MAVVDLWHKRGEVAACPECGQKAGPPSARHGRGLRWRVKVPGHPSESFAGKGQAERRERALWHTPKPVRGATVDDLVEAWVESKGHRAPATQAAARDAKAVVLARWSGYEPAQIEHDDVQAWLSGLQSKHGPASASKRQKALQCLSGALAIGVRRKMLPANPCDGVSVPKVPSREGRFLSLDDVQLIVDKVRTHAIELDYDPAPLAAMIWLMATTGLRVGEVCKLTVGSVDASRRRLRVVLAKGAKSRNVPVTQFVLDQLDLERPRDAPLFPAPRTGKHFTPTPWRRRWFNPAVEEAGLGEVHPHDLRHTAVSQAIHSGASIYDVQQMCGHSRPSTTLNIYGHLLDGHLDDVAARLEGRLATFTG